MLYYRVKEQCDNKNIYKRSRYMGFLIARELKTQKELDKIPTLYHSCFEPVEVSKKAIHYFFGARFADNYPYSDFAKSKYHY